MDAKALAKSKRAHSLHLNKKHNPHHHASKGSSAGSGSGSGDKKSVGKQVKEKPASKLPSNWDRYEEHDSDSEIIPQEGVSKTSDVVMPKSKGSDYAYLLSEAKAQFQYSSESVSLYDNVLDDFYQGLGSLLSAKGQSKLSWIAEDDFALEDKALPPTKSSFLSLDLHALSEQLERASLSERLFIEPDRLPLELFSEESQPAGKNKNEDSLASSKTSTVKKDSNPSASSSVYEGNNNKRQSSGSSHLGHESSNPLCAFKDGDGQPVAAEQYGPLQGGSEFNYSSSNKSSTFKAANAEAELDMLLNSFTEIEILDSTNVNDQSRPCSVPQAEVPTSLSEGSSSNHEVSTTRPKTGHALAKSPISDISLDDTLDDLLRETSTVTNKNEGSPSSEVNATAGETPSAPQSVSKSKIMDDFDSWFDTL